MLRTPLYSFHVARGAKMVEFAGWEMPLTYGSIIAEHQQVRMGAGLFDVSHMGRVTFKGRDAAKFLAKVCTRRIHDMAHGQCRYSLVCNERGGVKDDVLVYRYADDDFLVVVNASNRGKLLDHFAAQKGLMEVAIEDRTLVTAMVALQGPRVMDLVATVSSEIPTLKNYRFTVKSLFVFKATVSRTGYTGEDGVEVILPASAASMAVGMLAKGGSGAAAAADAVKPVGLGARDTLRLEAGMPLYGHEMDEETDPISAGLMFGINLEPSAGDDDPSHRPNFIGLEALRQIATKGPANKLVGLFLQGKRTARQGMTVSSGGTVVGRVTSGCTSPTLGRPIAMAYVPAQMSALGTVVQVKLSEENTVDAVVTGIPFYKRAGKKA